MDNFQYTQGFDTQFTDDFNLLSGDLADIIEGADPRNTNNKFAPTASVNGNINVNTTPVSGSDGAGSTNSLAFTGGSTSLNRSGTNINNYNNNNNKSSNSNDNNNNKNNTDTNTNTNPTLITNNFLSDNPELQLNGLEYLTLPTVSFNNVTDPNNANNTNNVNYTNAFNQEYYPDTISNLNLTGELPPTEILSPPPTQTVAPVPVVIPERPPIVPIPMSAPLPAGPPSTQESPLRPNRPSTAEPRITSGTHNDSTYPLLNPPSPSKLRRIRAKGETLEILKREFEANPSPSIEQRRKIAKVVGMPEKNVTIWFQNRRAKFKKKQRSLAVERQRYSPMRTTSRGEIYANVGSGLSVVGEVSEESRNGEDDPGLNSSCSEVRIPAFMDRFKFFDRIPFNCNANYNFADVCSITIGTWNRMKSGSILKKKFKLVKELKNLSPNSVCALMSDSTDLLVLISQKNFEVNYFFIAIANNTKILFRIFYPIDSIMDCSLTTEAGSSEELLSPGRITNIFGELRIVLSKPPNFAVYFLNNNEGDPDDVNQWSICEDFSEGRQVSTAYVGGSNIPHCLKGLHDSLRSMSNLISCYKSGTKPMSAPLGAGFSFEPPTIPLSPGTDRSGPLSLTPISPSISPNLGMTAAFSPGPLGSYFEDNVTGNNDFITRIYSNDSLTNPPSRISGSLQRLVENYDRSGHSGNTGLASYQSPVREPIEHVGSALSQSEQGSSQLPASDFLDENVAKLTGDTDDNLLSSLSGTYGNTGNENEDNDYFGFSPNFNPDGGQDIDITHFYDTNNDNNNVNK